ncbi:MAG: hypothetical protein FWD76_03565 [Firmicutes bacterium]|nr:hypothetical protein [Bacillota bacterium]
MDTKQPTVIVGQAYTQESSILQIRNAIWAFFEAGKFKIDQILAQVMASFERVANLLDRLIEQNILVYGDGVYYFR